jgi:hypothetical protein
VKTTKRRAANQNFLGKPRAKYAIDAKMDAVAAPAISGLPFSALETQPVNIPTNCWTCIRELEIMLFSQGILGLVY